MNWSIYVIIGLTLLCIFCISTIVFLLVKMLKNERRNQQVQFQFETLKNKMDSLHLESLESKLNPHLFKNVLNSIQSHAYQTYYSMDKLSNVLDYILYESRNRFVTPKEEIAFAMDLIEINKIKISPIFQLKVKVKTNENEPLFHQRLLAPLISIDLIENAFKHADFQSSDAFISIVYEFKDNVFHLTVTNKISHKSTLKKEKSGIGTETLENRLKIIYQDDFKIEKFVEGDIYFAHLKINLLDYKAKMYPVG